MLRGKIFLVSGGRVSFIHIFIMSRVLPSL